MPQFNLFAGLGDGPQYRMYSLIKRMYFAKSMILPSTYSTLPSAYLPLNPTPRLPPSASSSTAYCLLPSAYFLPHTAYCILSTTTLAEVDREVPSENFPGE